MSAAPDSKVRFPVPPHRVSEALGESYNSTCACVPVPRLRPSVLPRAVLHEFLKSRSDDAPSIVVQVGFLMRQGSG